MYSRGTAAEPFVITARRLVTYRKLRKKCGGLFSISNCWCGQWLTLQDGTGQSAVITVTTIGLIGMAATAADPAHHAKLKPDRKRLRTE